MADADFDEGIVCGGKRFENRNGLERVGRIWDVKPKPEIGEDRRHD